MYFIYMHIYVEGLTACSGQPRAYDKSPSGRACVSVQRYSHGSAASSERLAQTPPRLGADARGGVPKAHKFYYIISFMTRIHIYIYIYIYIYLKRSIGIGSSILSTS